MDLHSVETMEASLASDFVRELYGFICADECTDPRAAFKDFEGGRDQVFDVEFLDWITAIAHLNCYELFCTFSHSDMSGQAGNIQIEVPRWE
jgi:hypothetical protein